MCLLIKMMQLNCLAGEIAVATSIDVDRNNKMLLQHMRADSGNLNDEWRLVVRSNCEDCFECAKGAHAVCPAPAGAPLQYARGS